MNHRYFLTVFALLSAFVGSPSIARSQTTEQSNSTLPSSPSGDVVKVGEYQTKINTPAANNAVTQIHTHNKAGRQAATLYIRNIPVLTFVGKQQVASTDFKTETKVGAIGNVGGENGGVQQYAPNASNSSSVKVATVGENAGLANQDNLSNDDPVQKASIVAARINDLVRQKVDANKITVSWRRGGEVATANQAGNKNLSNQESEARYVIKVDGQEIVAIDSNTSLSDSTNNQAQDALQATNRLRRLIGNASPLTEIANLPVNVPAISIPRSPDQIAIAPVKQTLNGIASFYGYDGSGNKTATGERFNPEGMTAAHRHLPFGTRVRVTNIRNGRSVIVRINDRGPFIRGRIIDLSYGAARVIGMIGRGLAPVKVEVLGR
ncbi:septal ring lytic transglycosylase RlpA family protein [Calothrix sp. UHCC 0171]|uniref:septal ring lytic transglycosylase RlpA family protein n=1 Tax=Calothrix sp. UHCC 0171 TaxID=3110245 RepID=UPI002B203066|nr:septal ring lytic transglycosylase RlpA family protein [Calothrix sp. UHCC 0171]MEA5572013.1 septal ring lytic transglycosylase RlpA family protein [Calothrix sp. UHCC 0171]